MHDIIIYYSEKMSGGSSFFLNDFVDWEVVRSWLPPSWVLAIAGSAVAAYLIYKSVRILRTDCDLTLMSKSLRPQYFSDRVVWVTGASSGSKKKLILIFPHLSVFFASRRSFVSGAI